MDTHNRRWRYSWEIDDGQRVFVRGTDFVELDEAGRVARVDGFFGPLPPLGD
jgi:hypothetical protein